MFSFTMYVNHQKHPPRQEKFILFFFPNISQLYYVLTNIDLWENTVWAQSVTPFHEHETNPE